MRKIRLLLLPVFFLFILGSCDMVQPEFKGVSNFKTDQINAEKIKFNVDIETFNPNKKNIKIRKSKLQLYLNNRYIGDAELQEKYSMKRNSTTIQNVPVEIALQKGMLMSLIGIISSKKVEIKLVGDLKFSISGFPGKRKINEKKEIDLKDLGLGNLKELIGF